MDCRNVYLTLYELLAKENNPSFSSLLSDMEILSPDGYQTKRKGLMEKLRRLLPEDVVDPRMGCSKALAYLRFLKKEYPCLETYSLDRDEYVSRALEREAMTAYDLLYWLFVTLSATYSSDPVLKSLIKDFRPVLEDKDGNSALNPFLIDFIQGYKKKPTLEHDGYAYAASWLFGINAVTQTILTRIGLSLWLGIYPKFELYSPRGDEDRLKKVEVLFTPLTYDDGKEIRDYLPLFIYLGRHISFRSNERNHQIFFPYGGMDMKDILLSIDGQEKTYDFLDDLFKAMIEDGEDLWSLFAKAKDIVIDK